MQLQRLWQTLVYFDVIPWLNCWTRIFNRNDINFSTPKMNYILLSNSQSELAQQTLKYFLDLNLPIKLINISDNSFENKNNNLQIFNQELNDINYQDTYLLERVNKFICFPEKGIDNLINLIKQKLQPSEIILFDFTNPAQEIKDIWGAVDDVVMGGVSSSNLKLANQKAIFSGVVSTDNNGGFVSVRCKNFNPPWDLSAYEGIRLRIQGDGKRYKFITRCEGKWDGISYCYSFDTLVNTWMTIDIPFAELIPVFRAKTVKDAGKFDQSKVYAYQLMLSKFEYDGDLNPNFQAGFFSLEIESIKAYGAENSPQLILMGNASQWQDYNLNTSLLKIYAENPDDLDILIN